MSVSALRSFVSASFLTGSMLIGLLVVGCSAPSRSPQASVLPTIALEVVAEATKFRRNVGIRADEGWILVVERDPRSSDMPFGIRLMPDEIAVLEARARNAEAALPILLDYGREHGDDFGGAFIDQQGGGFVVVLFTGDTEIHAGALSRLLHPDARWVIREVQYSELELNALHDRVASDAAWFEAAGILLVSVATDVPINRVEIVFDSQDVGAADAIRERFQAGDAFTIVRDAHPVALLPRGSLAGRVIDSRGQPVPDLLIRAIGDIAEAEPDGGIAYGTDAEGAFVIPRLAAMGWEVQALIGVPDKGWMVIGSVHVDVDADTTTSVVIQIP